MKKYSLILFDMDGTIVDSDEMLFRSLFALYDKFNNGIRKPREQLYKYSGPPIEESLKKEFPNFDPELILNHYIKESAYYSELYIYPMKNIVKVCKELRNRGVKLGVVTNKHTENSIKTLQITKMTELFDTLIGYNQVTHHKPEGEGIIKAMEVLGIKDKNKVLYVGDNNIDYYTAINAGVDSAIVYWGPRVNTIDVEPTYKISDFNELLEVI